MPMCWYDQLGCLRFESRLGQNITVDPKGLKWSHFAVVLELYCGGILFWFHFLKCGLSILAHGDLLHRQSLFLSFRLFTLNFDDSVESLWLRFGHYNRLQIFGQTRRIVFTKRFGLILEAGHVNAFVLHAGCFLCCACVFLDRQLLRHSVYSTCQIICLFGWQHLWRVSKWINFVLG